MESDINVDLFALWLLKGFNYAVVKWKEKSQK